MLSITCKKIFYPVALLFFISGILVSCKKDDGAGIENLAKDSAWLYTKDLYLWNQNLPSGFNARSYSDPNAVMVALRAYSTEPGFTGPVDRWSFAATKKEWDDVSSGISGDFGLGIFFNDVNDLRVSYVEPASPAGNAGIKRSWRFTSINGNTTIDTTSSNITRIANAIQNSNTGTFIFHRPDNTDTTITLTAATYQEEPILLDSIYNVGGNKVGYLVYNSFLGSISTIKSRFNTLFNKFSSAGVSDMIVDLRYNGGGYVELQNELANYLVPSAGNGAVMLKEKFNDKYSSYYDTTINYAKKGSLNLSRIFFITTKNTASASELLINSLKPYMDVKLVGRASHGKPVGFFPLSAGNWYVFPVSFRSVNKNGEGNYFNGLQPDATVSDGLEKAWGDIDENCLAGVLHYISSGSFSRIANREQQDLLIEPGNVKLGSNKFRGAVDKRLLER
ncbi:MAG: S41 family peptidase [Agriterribacter sp.]